MAKKVVKTQKLTAKNPTHFYVGVASPNEIQRTVLEGSKGLLTVLARYEKLKQVRENKARALEKFHTQLVAIRSLVGKLSRSMPKYDLHITEPFTTGTPIVIDAPAKKIEEVKVEKKVTFAPQTELEKLEAELASIENKLTSI